MGSLARTWDPDTVVSQRMASWSIIGVGEPIEAPWPAHRHAGLENLGRPVPCPKSHKCPPGALAIGSSLEKCLAVRQPYSSQAASFSMPHSLHWRDAAAKSHEMPLAAKDTLARVTPRHSLRSLEQTSWTGELVQRPRMGYAHLCGEGKDLMRIWVLSHKRDQIQPEPRVLVPCSRLKSYPSYMSVTHYSAAKSM